MKCWEFKHCGRIPGGANVAEFGTCPAYSRGAGEACWMVAGTFCGGVVQGTFAQKQQNCMSCDFYKTFSLKHRADARSKFGKDMEPAA